MRALLALLLALAPVASGLEAPCEPSPLGLGGCTAWSFAFDGGHVEVEPFAWNQGGVDMVHALALSADGATGYAAASAETGSDDGLPVTDLLLFALDAGDGAERWRARLDLGDDVPADVLVRDELGLVFVTGTGSSGPAWNSDLFVAAFRTDDGSVAWVHQYDGPAHFRDHGVALAYSEAEGPTLVVAGTSMGIGRDGAGERDLVLVVLDPLTGERRSLTRWDGPLADSEEFARALALSPDGARAYVTGASSASAEGDEVVTAAFDVATGRARWAHRHDGPAHAWDFAGDVVASPDGRAVYVALGSGDDDSMDPLVVALDPARGGEQWSLRIPSSGLDSVTDAKLAEDGATLWIASRSGVRALDVDKREVDWHRPEGGARLALSPDERTVLTSLTAWNDGTGFDCVVRGYDARDGALVFAADHRGAGWGDGSAMDPLLRDTCGEIASTSDRIVVGGDTWRPGTSADGLVVGFRTAGIVRQP